jgi:hypothetical protein
VASRRKGWSSLSQSYRDRLVRNGITESRYERGHKLDVARGHAATPEHGLKEARRNPAKYRKYLNKRERTGVPPSGGPEQEGHEYNEAKDAAFYSIENQLGTYRKYNHNTVLANVYGGRTSESGDVPGMSLAEAKWTSRADAQQIRARASQQYTGNPWWYH